MDATLCDTYRQCFGTPAGRRALTQLLIDGGFFDDDLTKPEEIAVENFVKKILTNMGVFDITQLDLFVNKILELPVPK